jgi:dihydroorotase
MASLTSGDLAAAASPAPPPQDDATDKSKKYDLLVKGGTVIDPAQNLRALLDVAVKNGKIAEVSANIPENQAELVFPAKDRFVTPGLIDLHVHCYHGVTSAAPPAKTDLENSRRVIIIQASHQKL